MLECKRLRRQTIDVVEVQPKVDDVGAFPIAVTPGVVLQRVFDDDPGAIEIVQHQQRNVVSAQMPSTSSRAAVTDIPFDDMMAMS